MGSTIKHIEARYIEAVDVTNCSDCPHSYWNGENGNPTDDYGVAVCDLLGRKISDAVVLYREIDPGCLLPDKATEAKATEAKKKIGHLLLSKLFGK